MLRVAVVGSGPSGVYTAQGLVQQDGTGRAACDVLDRLPCPYGLVRYGVAPDHEKIKSLQNNLRTVLEHERVGSSAMCEVGPRTGCRPPGCGSCTTRSCTAWAPPPTAGSAFPGEELPGSCSATEFVSWYSAHPDAAGDGFVARGALRRGHRRRQRGGGRGPDPRARRGRAEPHRHAPGGARRARRQPGRATCTWWAGAALRRPSSPPRSCASWARCPDAEVMRRPGRAGAGPGVRRPVGALPRRASRRNVEVAARLGRGSHPRAGRAASGCGSSCARSSCSPTAGRVGGRPVRAHRAGRRRRA